MQLLKNVCLILNSGFFRYYLSGTDMTLTDYDGRTALHIAAAQGSNERSILIDILIDIILLLQWNPFMLFYMTSPLLPTNYA